MESREIRGRAALNAYYGDRTGQSRQPIPMIHNHLIDVEGDEASSICEMDLRLGVEGVTMIGAGYYQDQFRRVDGRWMFVLRDWTYFYWRPQQLD